MTRQTPIFPPPSLNSLPFILLTVWWPSVTNCGLMRILLTLLIFASSGLAQTRTAPQQGPPPKNLVRQPDGHFTANQEPANPEKFEVRVVKAGDTLSQIAAEVLQNPRLWPQLWEQNEHIVNPHWIYPNDKILIRPVTLITEAEPPPPEPPKEPVPEPPRRLRWSGRVSNPLRRRLPSRSGKPFFR